MSRKPVSFYAGSFNGRILEELGYRSKEDLLNAKVLDLLLIGSFSSYDIEGMILELIKEERPSMCERLNQDCIGNLEGVKVYGLTKDDFPGDRVKRITIRDVIHFRPLTPEKILVLFRILENSIMKKSLHDCLDDYEFDDDE